MTDIEAILKKYLAKEIAVDGHEELGDNTSLFESGLLDSISKMKLISFLERQFGIEIESHEANAENLETIALISRMVLRKKPALAKGA